MKIAHVLNFAFEVDVLEIHLNELYPIVDKIFICECAYVHGITGIKKPNMWNLIKNQSRFSKFQDKVVHFWIPEEDINIKSLQNDIWHVENEMETKRWWLFLKWNEDNNNYFTDDDLIGFGDADEIASIQTLNKIKQCETISIVDIGIWFTRGRITEKLKVDWPVVGEPYALGDPTYFTLRQAKLFPHNAPHFRGKIYVPGRLRGFAPTFVLGGLHLSSYRYLPQVLLKLLTMTETENTEYNTFERIVSRIKNGEDIQEIQKDSAKEEILLRGGGKHTAMDPKDIGTKQYILPWFLECNEQRYSTFYQNVLNEPRLDG